MNRIKGDVSTKAGCYAIADELTKAGVTKVCPPSPPEHVSDRRWIHWSIALEW